MTNADFSQASYQITAEDMELEELHEIGMAEEGKERYFKRALKDRESGNTSRTAGGRVIISQMVLPLADIITEEIARLEGGNVRRKPPEVRTLKLLPPKDIALLALLRVIDRTAVDGTGFPTQQNVGFTIGNSIALEHMARSFRKKDRGMFKAIVKRTQARNASPQQRQKELASKFKELSDQQVDPMDATEKVRLGVFLLRGLASLGIVELVTLSSGKKASTHCVLSDKAVEQISKTDEAFSELQPYLGPTLVPPRPWTSTNDGGYWLGFKGMGMITARNRSNGISYADATEMPHVFEAVNYLQNVPYKINKQVLEVVKQMQRYNLQCSSLPPSELEAAPPKPYDIDTNEEARKTWRIAAREVHGRNTAAKGKILSIMKTVSIAKKHQDSPEIYFPKCLDFRGRVYDLPMFLKPQGGDLAKGLLTFANGKPLGDQGFFWLAVQGANVWGEDKCSLEDRVKWVEANEARILRVADAPLDERFWMDADKPFQFLAFCFEWAAASAVGEDYVSTLPVALDGSCNGLQHLSAMLRDPIGGEAVNLLPAAVPQDIYSKVADKVLEVLREKAAAGEPTAQRWIPLISRKTVKRNVMTLPYGATRTGFSDQIMEDTLRPLQREGLCPFSEPYNAARYLGEIVWDATGSVVVAAQSAMGWLQECAKIVSKAGHSVQWTAPSGFVVKQDYRKSKSRKVELVALGQRVTVRVADGHVDKSDSRKMAASVAPNFVHAMDAAHMLRTVQLMTETDKYIHFSMVHDSYATHAADTETLSQLIRQAFVQMYQEGNWLQRFKEDLETSTGLELPDVPESGDLNLNKVMNSLYFFA